MSKHTFGSIDNAKVAAAISENDAVWPHEYYVVPNGTRITCKVMDCHHILANVKIGDHVDLEELDITFNNGEIVYWLEKPGQLVRHTGPKR